MRGVFDGLGDLVGVGDDVDLVGLCEGLPDGKSLGDADGLSVGAFDGFDDSLWHN